MSNIIPTWDFFNKLKQLITAEEQKAQPQLIIKKDGLEFFPEPSISLLTEVSKVIERARYRNATYSYAGKTVVGEYVVMNEHWGGAISEILFQSEVAGGVKNKEYSVQILADGNVAYNNSWDEFAVKSNYLQDMSCYANATYYILTFNTIFFDESILIRVYNASSPLFTNIYVKAIRRLI